MNKKCINLKVNLAIFFMLGTFASQAQNVGINTTQPQAILHIDALKNNNNTIPTSSSVKDDVVVTKNGRLGIGTTNPRTTIEIVAKEPTGTTTTPEGILVPRVSRARAKSMIGVEKGNLIYIDDTSDYLTDNSPGNSVYVSRPGLYYFNGTHWALFESVYTTPDGKAEGLYIRKVKWLGEVVNAASTNTIAPNNVTCSKFQFDLFKDSAGNYWPRWVHNTGVDITIEGAYRVIHPVEDNAHQQHFFNTQRSLVYYSVPMKIQSDFPLEINSIHEFFVTYPDDTSYYQITFARVENGPGVNDNLNVITCKKY